MNFDSDSCVAIDPQLRLKNDVDRAVIINRPLPLSSRDDLFIFLHPKDAVILSLFDGARTVGDIGQLWAEITDRTVHTARREIDRVLDEYSRINGAPGTIFVQVNEENRGSIHSYDGLDFIMDRSTVNLTDLRLRKPYMIYYLPTLFCPQKCIYCYAKTVGAREENPLSLERLREIFQELSDLGVEAIGLSGGDPLARKDIFEIISCILEMGMTPDIPTKVGLGQQRLETLYDMGIRVMQVSIDSAEPGAIDTMVGIPGYHRRVFRLLEKLREVGMRVRVNSVITPINYRTIGNLIDYLGSLGNVFQVFLTPYARSLFCHQDELFLDVDQHEQVREQVAEKEPLYPHMSINLGGSSPRLPQSDGENGRAWKARSHCSANRQGFVILPDGRVTVCEELYDHPDYIIGDLSTQSVMEVWNSPHALDLIHPEQSSVPDGPCKTCGGFVECNSKKGRCWRDVLKAYGWSKPHYPDPRCPKAPPAPRIS